jgi:hypothetical protein
MVTIEDLQEVIEDIFPNGLPKHFKIELDENNQVIIHTGLVQDEDGDLSEYETDDEDDDYEEDDEDDCDGDDEEDEDFESLDEEDDDDE